MQNTLDSTEVKPWVSSLGIMWSVSQRALESTTRNVFLIPNESGRCVDLQLSTFFKDKTRRNIAVFRLQGLRKEFLFFGFLNKTVLIDLFSTSFVLCFYYNFQALGLFQISGTRWNAVEVFLLTERICSVSTGVPGHTVHGACSTEALGPSQLRDFMEIKNNQITDPKGCWVLRQLLICFL